MFYRVCAKGRGIVVALGILFGLAASLVTMTNPSLTVEQAAAASTVRVNVGKGHGTGVVIAKGVVITAKHVVENAPEVKVVLDNGVEKPGTVLWVGSGRNDVALVAAATDDVEPMPVNCARTKAGMPVFTYGYPMTLSRITTWGRVATDVPFTGEDMLLDAIALNLVVAPGNSGGGVFDAYGLRGIVVAIPAFQTGFMQSSPAVGLALMVPSTVLCLLLGRNP